MKTGKIPATGMELISGFMTQNRHSDQISAMGQGVHDRKICSLTGKRPPRKPGCTELLFLMCFTVKIGGKWGKELGNMRI